MDILCYGDSNTYGTKPMAALGAGGRFGRDQRWPCVMAGALGADWHVIEAGLPGRTTVFDDPVEGAYRNGLRVFQAVLESHRPLDAVTIMLGTNDLKQRFDVPALDVALGLRRLVDVALATEGVGAVLVIAPPVPGERGCLAEMFGGAVARGAGLAGHMVRVAQERGVGFLDAGSVISVDPLDGVHFDAASHGALGRAVAAAVQTLVAD